MTALLPCPWPKCGGIADLHENGKFVACRACGAEGPHCEDDGEAEAAWNSLPRRPPSPVGRDGEIQKLFDQFNTEKIDAATFGYRVFDVLCNERDLGSPQAGLGGPAKGPSDAIEALANSQFQIDEDGTNIGVSRQALEEVLAYLRSPSPWRSMVEQAAGVADDYAETYDRENRTAYTVEHATRALACKELAEEIAASIRALPSPPSEGEK